MTSVLLRDHSGGRLKAWPASGTWLAGVFVPTFVPAGSGDTTANEVRPARRRGRWIYCKYCYRNALPLVLREAVNRHVTEMVICSRCAAGLTRPEPAPH